MCDSTMAAPGPRANGDLFSRQYVLGSSFVQLAGWHHSRVFDSFCLSTHPRLVSTAFKADDREVLCLGDIYDPNQPQSDNKEVLERLIRAISTFSDFEDFTRSAGGSWVIFLRIGSDIRVYPDPTGSRPVYYCESDGLWFGTTPQIIGETLHLEKDEGLIAEFNGHQRGSWWPGEVTPYREVLRLIPNHYLDFARRTASRFWPKGDIAQTDVDTGSREVLRLLHGITLAAVNRYRVYMAITGGYDSRATLAGARGLWDRLNFFTVDHPGIDSLDLEIPRRIGKRLRLKYSVVPFVEPSREFLDLFDRNSAGMVSGQCRLNAMSYREFSDDAVFIEGTVSPIGRADYYKSSPHPATITVKMLCDRSWFSGNPVAFRAFDKWLQGVPSNTNIKTLDLFYWEQRAGSWGAMDISSQGITRQVFSAFNCRQILETMLGVPVEDRQSPFRLHRRMCELMLPELRWVRFNTSWRRDARHLARLVQGRFHRYVRSFRPAGVEKR